MKAKLIMVMPKNCGECDFVTYSQTGFRKCAASSLWLNHDFDLNTKHELCPLIPVEGEE